MIKMHNTPPWVDSIRMNFDYIAKHLTKTAPAVTDDGSVVLTLEPDTLYDFTGNLTTLDLTVSSTRHYHFGFNSGNPAVTLNLPVDIQMPDNFSVEADKHYEVDILNGWGAVLSWTIS